MISTFFANGNNKLLVHFSEFIERKTWNKKGYTIWLQCCFDAI